jgi:tetratricopeptide (TPR) repeat protein
LKARIAAQLGDIPGAEAGYVRTIASARAAREVNIECKALAEQAALLVEAGEYAQAQRALPLADARLRSTYPPSHWLFGILRMQDALLAEHRGDAAAAKRSADAAISLLESNSALTYQFPISLVQRAGIEQRAGLYKEAHSDAERAIAIYADTLGAELRSAGAGDAFMVAAQTSKALGNARAAREQFAQAVLHYQSSLGADHPKTQAANQLAKTL